MILSSVDLPDAVRSQHADLRARQERQRDVREHLAIRAEELVDPVHGVDVVAHRRATIAAGDASARSRQDDDGRCGRGHVAGGEVLVEEASKHVVRPERTERVARPRRPSRRARCDRAAKRANAASEVTFEVRRGRDRRRRTRRARARRAARGRPAPARSPRRPDPVRTELGSGGAAARDGRSWSSASTRGARHAAGRVRLCRCGRDWPLPARDGPAPDRAGTAAHLRAPLPRADRRVPRETSASSGSSSPTRMVCARSVPGPSSPRYSSASTTDG